jgi:hypothetical protein
MVLCDACVRARGGSSAVGHESTVRILAGVCDDCGAAICSCRGRHGSLPSCPLVMSPVRGASSLRVFRPFDVPPPPSTLPECL